MSFIGFKAKNHPQQVATRGARDDVDDRRTPQDFWDALDRQHGFTLDAAASAENAKCERFYTLEDDGLDQSWAGERVWCNPPYSNCQAWVEKAWAEWNRGFPHGGAQRIVMLLPSNRVEQGWWQNLVEPFRDQPDGDLRVQFLRSRMRFGHPPGWVVPEKGDRPPFGVCLLTWESR